jgi:hypothetical protein
LPALRSGTETRDFDSTDPAQTNADFDHPLRVTADGQYVIAEAYGPGEIVSIWSTIIQSIHKPWRIRWPPWKAPGC